jgi:hypothetical protein
VSCDIEIVMVKRIIYEVENLTNRTDLKGWFVPSE